MGGRYGIGDTLLDFGFMALVFWILDFVGKGDGTGKDLRQVLDELWLFIPYVFNNFEFPFMRKAEHFVVF